MLKEERRKLRELPESKNEIKCDRTNLKMYDDQHLWRAKISEENRLN